ncbi:MAG: hypothetical protein LUC37_06820 [Prevotella sp.]|nr:hypothetical protein [Prevotella sp.]
MYERTVEVEDLNRNFWVIGQVLSGLCAYLFDDDSPLVQMLQGLLDELIQLWENVAYLWAASALNSHKKYTDIKTVFVPMWNDETMPYVKFDNFVPIGASEESQKLLQNVAKNRLEYLKGEYGESNLVIVPEVRWGNYMKNYYYRVQYPGMIIYNRNDNSTCYFVFKSDDTPYLQFDLSGQTQSLQGSNLNSFVDYGDNYYINVTEDCEDKVNGYETYAIRTVFDCSTSITSDLDILVSNISFDFIDVAAKLYNNGGTFLTVTIDDCSTEGKYDGRVSLMDFYTQYFNVSLNENLK